MKDFKSAQIFKGLKNIVVAIICIVLIFITLNYTLYGAYKVRGIEYFLNTRSLVLLMFPGIPVFLMLIFAIGNLRSALEQFRLGIKGEFYHGVIVGHDIHETQDSNGHKETYIGALNVRYQEDGYVGEAYVTCRSTSVSKGTQMTYPLNSCITFLMIPGTNIATYVAPIPYFEGKEDLMLEAGENTSKSGKVLRRNFITCLCPKCGAEVQIANHGTATCQYCGQFISYDDDSEDDMYDVTAQKVYRNMRG